MIDGEVREIINEHYMKAFEILQDKNQVLERVAQLLLEKEKIDGSEPKAIMDDISKNSE